MLIADHKLLIPKASPLFCLTDSENTYGANYQNNYIH